MKISYEITGGELTALLLESNEIKTLKPIYNSAQKRTKFPIGVYHYKNEDGYICFNVTKDKKQVGVIAEYPKASTAQSVLFGVARQFELCKPLCNVETVLGNNCFNYQLSLCRGACMKKEDVEEYNERAESAIEKLKLEFDTNFFIIEEGRSKDEKAVILIENGEYKGFGFVETEQSANLYDLKESIKSYPTNPDVSKIIKQHLKTKKSYKVLRF